MALEAYRSLVKKGEEQVNKAQEYTDGLIESEEKKFEERIKSQFCLMSTSRGFAELPLIEGEAPGGQALGGHLR